MKNKKSITKLVLYFANLALAVVGLVILSSILDINIINAICLMLGGLAITVGTIDILWLLCDDLLNYTKRFAKRESKDETS